MWCEYVVNVPRILLFAGDCGECGANIHSIQFLPQIHSQHIRHRQRSNHSRMKLQQLIAAHLQQDFVFQSTFPPFAVHSLQDDIWITDMKSRSSFKIWREKPSCLYSSNSRVSGDPEKSSQNVVHSGYMLILFSAVWQSELPRLLSYLHT